MMTLRLAWSDGTTDYLTIPAPAARRLARLLTHRCPRWRRRRCRHVTLTALSMAERDGQMHD
jgi:hypothetical protein